VDEGVGRAFVVHDVAYANGRPAPLVTMLDAHTGAAVRTIRLPLSATRVAVAAPIVLSQRTHHAFIPAMAGPDLWTLDTRTGNTIHTTVIGPGNWHAIALDDPSNTLVVGTGGTTRGSIAIVDTRSGRRLRMIPVGIEPTDIALDGQRQRAFLGVDHTTLHHPSYTVETLDLRSGRIIHTVSFGAYWSWAVDARSGRLYVLATTPNNTNRRAISVIDGATGAIVGRVSTGSADSGITAAPGGRRVLITGSASCSFSLPLLWSCNDQRGIVTIINTDTIAAAPSTP